MMFELTHPLPKKYFVACSGGVDSMAVLHWLTKHGADNMVGVLHVHHNTGKFADDSLALVRDYCIDKRFSLTTYKITEKCPSGRSKEEWWRVKRIGFFDSVMPKDAEIILAHQFNDCVEEYLMCTLRRGYTGTIPYGRGRCVRPFRLWKKESIRQYAAENKVPYVEDPSNEDVVHARNFIRHKIVPEAFTLNPGLYNIVKKAMEEQE